MDTLTTTIISSAVAVVVAVIGTLASSRKLDKNLSAHDKSSEKNKELLSAEHSGIQKDIQVAAASTQKDVGEVHVMLSKLRLHMLKKRCAE